MKELFQDELKDKIPEKFDSTLTSPVFETYEEEIHKNIEPKPEDPTYEELTPKQRRKIRVIVLRLKRKQRRAHAMFKAHQKAMFEWKKIHSELDKENIRHQKMITPIEIVEAHDPRVRRTRKKTAQEIALESLASNPQAQKELMALLEKHSK